MHVPTVAEFLEMDTSQQVEVVLQHLTEVVWPHIVVDPEKVKIARDMKEALEAWLRYPAMREVLPDQDMRARCVLYHQTTMLGGSVQ